MTTKVYCYNCMSYHSPDEMRKVTTKAGERWRCIRSIEAAGAGPSERDAFGRSMSELNRARTRYFQERSSRDRQLMENRC